LEPGVHARKDTQPWEVCALDDGDEFQPVDNQDWDGTNLKEEPWNVTLGEGQVVAHPGNPV